MQDWFLTTCSMRNQHIQGSWKHSNEENGLSYEEKEYVHEKNKIMKYFTCSELATL
jgi:hypothetical protein